MDVRPTIYSPIPQILSKLAKHNYLNSFLFSSVVDFYFIFLRLRATSMHCSMNTLCGYGCRSIVLLFADIMYALFCFFVIIFPPTLKKKKKLSATANFFWPPPTFMAPRIFS